MTKNVRTQLNKVIGKSLNGYHAKVKSKLDELKFKEQYQGRIIDCMVGEVDDNYIETPSTDNPIVKLEHSKEGVVKVPSMKGKTVLVDAEGNETDTPSEGCRLVSVGENENNKLIILSKNKNIVNRKVADMRHSQGNYVTSDNGGHAKPSSIEYLPKGKYMFSIDGYDISNFVDASIIIWKKDLLTQTCRRTRINQPFEILDGEVGFTWYGAVDAGKGETITQLVGKNIQIELGETRTSYVEPKHHKTEILLDEPLRSLPNGVCDEIIGNKLIRRVGFTNLNGVNQWWHHWNDIELQNGSNDDYYVGSNGALIKCTNKKILKSNRLQKIGLYEPNLGYINAGGANEFGIRIPMNLLTERTEEEFKNWINSNNIQVMYELAEPVVIEMPNTLTLQGFDDTTMYIENEITPTVQYGYNALIPYKKELEMQQQEVKTNTLDIERNIIPYLMDMEMNLMLMEDN